MVVFPSLPFPHFLSKPADLCGLIEYAIRIAAMVAFPAFELA
jgi:hypothetical protein